MWMRKNAEKERSRDTIREDRNERPLTLLFGISPVSASCNCHGRLAGSEIPVDRSLLLGLPSQILLAGQGVDGLGPRHERAPHPEIGKLEIRTAVSFLLTFVSEL